MPHNLYYGILVFRQDFIIREDIIKIINIRPSIEYPLLFQKFHMQKCHWFLKDWFVILLLEK